MAGSLEDRRRRNGRRNRRNVVLGEQLGAVERLEQKVLMAVRVWDGGGGDALWTTAANWEDDTAPVENDELVFPALAAQLTNTNDFAANTNFASITIESSGYDLDGNIVDLDGNVIATYTTGTSAVSLGIALQATIDVDVAVDSRLILSGAITGSGFGLTKIGGGTLELAGSTMNSFNGISNVNAGTLELNKSSGVAIAGNIVVGDGTGTDDTLRLLGGSQTNTTSIVTVNENATLDVNGQSNTIHALNLTGGTALTGTGGLLTLGTGYLTTSVSPNNVMAAIEGPGSISFNGHPSYLLTVADDPTLPIDFAISAVITNGGPMKLGLGTVAFSGDNTYAGTTAISAGGIQVESDTALGSTATGTSVASGAFLHFVGTRAIAEPFNVQGSGVGNTGALSVRSGSATLTGDIGLNSNSRVGAADGATLTINGEIDDVGDPFTLTVGDGATGRVVLGANNSFFNSQVNAVSGYLRLTNDGALGDAASSTTSTIQSGATLELAGGIMIPATKALEISGLPVASTSKVMNVLGDNTIAGDIDITGGNNVAFDVATGTTLTLSGAISGALDFDKNGPGMLVLSGTSTQTGNVNVGDGTLIVNGSLATSNLVFVDGTLGGSGTVPAVTISAIGRLSPGNSPGILSTGDLALQSGGALLVELDGTTVGSQYDQVDVTGTVDLGGATLTISVGYNLAIGDEFTIISNDSTDAITGTFNGLAEGATITIGAATLTISYAGGTDDNDVVLTVTDVTFTWDGGGGDNNWSTAANWSLDIAPYEGANLVFPDQFDRLDNTNDYAANTNFNNITLSGAYYTLNGNAIDLDGTIAATYTSDTAYIYLPISLQADQEISVATGGTLHIDAAISGTGFGVTKTGGGTLSFGGSAAANTYTGATNVVEGTLVLNKDGGIDAFAGDLVIGDGVTTATVQLANPGQIPNGSNVTVDAGSTLDLNGFDDTIGALTMTGATVQTGLGTLTLGGDVTTLASSTASVISGNLDLGGATRTFVVADGSAGTDLTVSAAISGTGAGIIKGGAASFMQISGNNTYDGTTTVSTGGLGAANANALGTTSAGTVVSSGATLALQGGNTFAAEPVTLSGNGAGNLGALWNSSGANTWTGEITLAANSFIGAESSAPLTISGQITDGASSFAITKVRSGTVTLTGANTYDGGTTVSAGTLQAGNDTALGSAAATVSSGATLAIGGGVVLANDLTISGTGAGSNGAMRNVSGENTLSGTITLAADSTITVSAGTRLELSGAVGGGSFVVFKTGAGTLELSGTNTLVGLFVQGGTVLVTGSSPLTTNGVVLSTGATLGGDGTVGSIASTGGTVAPGTSPGVLSSGPVTLDSNSAFSVEIDGTTVGTQYDQLNVTGTVTLGGATLQVIPGFTPSIGDTFTIIASSVGISGTFDGLAQGDTFLAGNIEFMIDYAGGGSGFDVVLTVIDIVYIWDGGDADDSLWSSPDNWVGNVAPTAGSNLRFADGADRLSNTNDFVDGTDFGTITIAGAGYTLAGNRIDLTGDILATYTTGSSAISAGLKLMNSATVDVAASGGLDLTGQITSDDFTQDLTKTGAGTLRFSGSVDNLFDDVFANQGTVALAMANGSNVNSSDLVVGDNSTAATVIFEADRQLWAGANVTVNEGSTLDLSTFDADISNLYLQGATVLIADGGLLEIFIGVFSTATTNNATSSITGAGSLGQSGSQFAFNVADDADLAIDLSVGVVVAGSNTVSKTGAGTLELTGDNVYTGSTAVTAGTLSIAGDNNLGGGSIELAGGSTLAVTATTTIDNAVALTGNATLALTSSTAVTLSGLISGSAALTASGSGDLALTNTGNEAAFSGAITVAGSVHLQVADDDALGSGDLILSGGWLYLVGDTTVDNDITLNSLAVIHVEPGITAGISGDIGESGGSRGFNKSGSGTLVLGGTSTYTGNTTLNGGVVSVASDANLGSGPVVLNNSSPTLRLAGAGPFDNEIQVSKPGVTIDRTADTELSGVISGASNLTITGSGVMTLSGTATHTGSVTIASGTVAVNGSLASSSEVIVQAGATLGGTGTLPAISSTGGTVAPGNSPGILASGNVTFDSGTTFEVELDGTTVGTEYDRLDVTGTVDLGGATLVVSLGFAPVIGDEFTIINNDSNDAITGTFNGLAEGATFDDGAYQFTISYVGGDGNDVVLTVTDISFVWSGASVDGREWSRGENWVGGIAPTAGSRLIFADSPVQTESLNDFAGGTAFHSILIAGAGYDIYGNAIDLAGGIETTYASGSSAFDLATELTGAQAFDVASGGTLTFTGALSGGAVLLTKAGGGTLVLSNMGNEAGLTGGVTVSGGTLSAAADDALPAGTITLDIGTTLALTGATTIDNAVALAGDATISTSADATLSGLLSGAFTLTKSGGSTLALTNTGNEAAFSGGVTVSGGTLAAAADDALPAGTITLAAGTTLAITGATTIDNAVALAGAATIDTSAIVTLSGLLSGASTLTKAGAGALFLTNTGNEAAFSGGVTVSGGTLAAAADDALPAGSITLADGTALAITGATTIDNAVALAGSAAIDTSADSTLSGLLSGSSTLVKSGSSTLTLTNLGNSAAFSGDLSIDDGGLSIADADALTSGELILEAGTIFIVTGETDITNDITFNGAASLSAIADFTISGLLTGSAAITKTGTETLTLTNLGNEAAHSGAITVATGTLAIADDNALPAGAITLGINTVLAITGETTIDNDISIIGHGEISASADATISSVISGAASLNKTGASTLTLSGANTRLGVTNINAGTLAVTGGSALPDVLGTTVVAGATLELLGDETVVLLGAGSVVLSGGDLTTALVSIFSGNISGTGNVTYTGVSVALTGTNTYSGSTTISTLGSIENGASIPDDSAVTITAGATLILVGPHETIGSLAGSGNLFSGSYPLTTGGDNTDTTFSGSISQTGSLIKVGTGTMTLDGISTYTGATLVSGGTLVVNGSIADSSSLTMADGTILGGLGTVPSLIVQSGATVAPGNSPGTLTVDGTLDFASGSTFSVEINGTIAIDEYDQMIALGTIDLGGSTLLVTLGDGFDPAVGDQFLILDNQGGSPIVGTFDGLGEGDLYEVGGIAFRISYLGGDGDDVELTAVVAPTVTVESSANPAAFGQSVTYTVTVSNPDITPTGNVTLYVNGSIYDTETLDGAGVATFIVSGLNVGLNTIVAEYSGDSNFLPSEGELAGGQVVGEAPSSTSVTASANPSVFGQSVTFSATVAGTMLGMPTPTGTVDFYDGDILLGSATLTDGTATFTISTLQVGGHSITANYLGDEFYQASTSPVFVQGVNFAEVELDITPSGQSAVVGQPLTFQISTATIAPGVGTPQGTVRVSINGVPEEDVLLDSNGEGSVTIVLGSTGAFDISFQFLNNTSFVGADVVTLPVTITPGSTVTTLASSTGLTVVGQAVTLTATVASQTPGSGTPDGVVSFFQGNQLLGSAPLVNGVATLVVSSLPYGQVAVGASYEGSSAYDASASGTVAIKVSVVLGDYDGDGKADLSLYEYIPALNSGQFTILLSAGGTLSALIGGEGAIPVVGDFDGDGKSDMAVFNPIGNGATWIIQNSSTGVRSVIQFGAANLEDLPVPADYDGDGITDIATFRPTSDLTPGSAEWFILPSSGASAYSVAFGASGGVDQPVPADYDGDGKADIATFRADSDIVPGTAQWFILPSDGSSASMISLGQVGSLSAPGGYGGPAEADLGTFDRALAQWRFRAFSDPAVTQVTYGQRSARVVPVLATLQDRLDAVGDDDDSESTDPDLVDELLAGLFLDN